MIKTFEDVSKESTCLKRLTITEIYDKDDILLCRESNRCDPKGGVCYRIGVVQTKENYEGSDCLCNWTHSEIMAIQALEVNFRLPYRVVVYGHDFICDDCEKRLRQLGVKVFEVVPVIPLGWLHWKIIYIMIQEVEIENHGIFKVKHDLLHRFKSRLKLHTDEKKI